MKINSIVFFGATVFLFMTSQVVLAQTGASVPLESRYITFANDEEALKNLQLTRFEPDNKMFRVDYDARDYQLVFSAAETDCSEKFDDKLQIMGCPVLQKKDAKGAASLLITYDSGPSDDPTFWLYQMKNGKWVAPMDSEQNPMTLDGPRLMAAAGTVFYTQSDSNKMYVKHRKFILSSVSKLTEVLQDMYLVGMETYALLPLTLTTAPVKGSEKGSDVARIAQGARVTVLAAKNLDKSYLIKSSTGLLGWVTLDPSVLTGQCTSQYALKESIEQGQPIKPTSPISPLLDICFHGD